MGDNPVLWRLQLRYKRADNNFEISKPHV